MSSRASDKPWIQRTKWLTQALIISGALNVGLVATFVYFVLQDRHQSLAIESKPVLKEQNGTVHSKEEVLRAYSFLPYSELLLRLDNKDFVEEGLTKRDIALACLVAFHHFNLEKALGGIGLQKRQIVLSHPDGTESIDVSVYPGLADFQFQAISQYARTEKWPLTAQGLFYEIQRSSLPYDPSLLEAFYLSSEFHALQTLFAKSGLSLPFEKLIELLCQGDWKTLADLAASQRQMLDVSVDRRRSFLVQYVTHRSSVAAELLLHTDREFVIKSLDDAKILMILDLSPQITPELELFAKELLASPRTDAVWKRAASLCKESCSPQLSLPQSQPIVTPDEAVPKDAPSPKKRVHIVQAGDSLWKIARKYQVSIQEIMKANHLESERLRLGKQLEIPENNKPLVKKN